MGKWRMEGLFDPLFKGMAGSPGDPGFMSRPLSSIANAVGPRIGTMLLNVTTNSGFRMSDYGSNVIGLNQIPSAQELIKLWHSKLLSARDFSDWMKYHSIPFGDISGWNADLHTLWRTVIDNNQPRFPIDMLRKWKRQGRQFADSELVRTLIAEGYSDRWKQDLVTDDYENLDLQTILTLYFRGEMILADALMGLYHLGFRAEEANKIISARAVKVDPQTAMVMLLRGQFNEPEVEQAFKNQGITDNALIHKLLTSRFAGPTPAGVVSAAGRQCWSQPLADLWGLDGDMPAEFPTWAARVGLDFSAGTGQYGETDNNSRNWATMLWREHWGLPSTELLAKIIHRFRGDPRDSSTWSEPGYPPLSQQDVWDTMTAMGIPSRLRGYLGRLVYLPISVRHIRLVAKYNNPGFQWIWDRYQDAGYKQDHAYQLARALTADLNSAGDRNNEALRRSTWRKLIGTIEDSYEAGGLDHAGATVQLISHGVEAETADVLLATVDIKVAAGIIRKVVARAKSDVFSGRTTMAAAGQRLLRAGMVPARATQTIAAWQAEFGEGRKHVASEKVLSLLRKGFITAAEALTRLDNLGWARPDELLLLAEVQAQVSDDEAKHLRSIDLAKQKQEREAERALRNIAQGANRIQQRLKTLTPPAKVVKWFVDGVWTEEKARDRLRLLSYPDDIIDTMFLDALVGGKGKKAGKDNGEAGPSDVAGTGNQGENGGTLPPDSGSNGQGKGTGAESAG